MILAFILDKGDVRDSDNRARPELVPCTYKGKVPRSISPNAKYCIMQSRSTSLVLRQVPPEEKLSIADSRKQLIIQRLKEIQYASGEDISAWIDEANKGLLDIVLKTFMIAPKDLIENFSVEKVFDVLEADYTRRHADTGTGSTPGADTGTDTSADTSADTGTGSTPGTDTGTDTSADTGTGSTPSAGELPQEGKRHAVSNDWFEDKVVCFYDKSIYLVPEFPKLQGFFAWIGSLTKIADNVAIQDVLAWKDTGRPVKKSPDFPILMYGGVLYYSRKDALHNVAIPENVQSRLYQPCAWFARNYAAGSDEGSVVIADCEMPESVYCMGDEYVVKKEVPQTPTPAPVPAPAPVQSATVLPTLPDNEPPVRLYGPVAWAVSEVAELPATYYCKARAARKSVVVEDDSLATRSAYMGFRILVLQGQKPTEVVRECALEAQELSEKLFGQIRLNDVVTAMASSLVAEIVISANSMISRRVDHV